jgi:ElaA protein
VNSIVHESRLDVSWQCLHFGTLTAVQVYEMLRLRQDVFLLEQRCFYRDADVLDLQCWHVLASTPSGQLVACARLMPPTQGAEEPSIGRVVVAPSWRSQGVGRALMDEALAFAEARYPGRAIRINAQAHLERFYSQLGFTRVGDVHDDAGILHCEMRRHPHDVLNVRV